jgi:hypothetical protein
MKRFVIVIFLISSLTACQQVDNTAMPTTTFTPTATMAATPTFEPALTVVPTNVFTPYYGR